MNVSVEEVGAASEMVTVILAEPSGVAESSEMSNEHPPLSPVRTSTSSPTATPVGTTQVNVVVLTHVACAWSGDSSLASTSLNGSTTRDFTMILLPELTKRRNLTHNPSHISMTSLEERYGVMK